MFAIVVNNEVYHRCANIDDIPMAVQSVIAKFNGVPSRDPWGHTIQVYASVGSYTTKAVESWPKEKSYNSGCSCCEP